MNFDVNDPEFLKLFLSQAGYDSEADDLASQAQMVQALRANQPQYRTGWGGAAGAVGQVLNGINAALIRSKQQENAEKRRGALDEFINGPERKKRMYGTLETPWADDPSGEFMG